MRLIIPFIFATILMSGCATVLKFGKNDTLRYISYGPPNVIHTYLTLNRNGTFTYHLRSGEVYINGNWIVHEDTIILTSEGFATPYDKLDPVTKESVRLGNAGKIDSLMTEHPDSAMRVAMRFTNWSFSYHPNSVDKDIFLIKGRKLYENNNDGYLYPAFYRYMTTCDKKKFRRAVYIP